MKKIIFWITLAVVLGLMNFQIFHKEKTIAHGQTMLLKLAPRDPRSLMQGDYMVLRYEIVDAAVQAVALKDKGYLVVSLNEHQVAKYVRIHNGEPLATNEFLLLYRNRDGLRLGAESFMFQEGDAGLYDQARYGELKVDANGASVLVGLRDEKWTSLGNKKVFE
ncbi:MAG: hypothetical protein EHM45_04050 [Desulfobacteraceae bacterium]|nr:MAG: hypothetical protein EHM45_04050 [Desulfobacteraceae bacterium]